MKNKIEIYKAEVNPIITQATQTQITSPDTMASATLLLSQININLDKIKAEKKTIIDPAKAIIARENDRWEPLETPLTEAKDLIRKEMSRYQTQAAQAAEAEKEKIAARIKAGSGNLSLETAAKKMDAITTPEKKTTTEAGSVSFRAYPMFEVVNIEEMITKKAQDGKMEIDWNAVKTLLMPNEQAIKRLNDAGIQLAGVRYWTEQRPINRRA